MECSELDDGRSGLGRAKLLGFGPHLMEFRVGEFRAVDGATDRGPLQSLHLHRDLKFLHGEIGRRQSKRDEGREPVGP
jgi:hypothetical protein